MLTISKDYIPALASIIVAILTVATNLWLGIAKSKLDTKSAKISDDNSLRDDLLELAERYETRIQALENQLSTRDERYESKIQVLEQQIILKDQLVEKKNQQIEQYQKQIAEQYYQIGDLNITIKQLQIEVKELRDQLEMFNKKVFYIPRTEKEKE